MNQIDYLKTLQPTKRDIERAESAKWNRNSFYGNGAPFAFKIKAIHRIKDIEKLTKRAKAFIIIYGAGETVGYSGGEPIEKDRVDILDECLLAFSRLNIGRSDAIEIILS